MPVISVGFVMMAPSLGVRICAIGGAEAGFTVTLTLMEAVNVPSVAVNWNE